MALGVFMIFFVFKKFGMKGALWTFNRDVARGLKDQWLKQSKFIIVSFVLISGAVAGPFVVKGLYYSGTPLYPFQSGAVNINKNIDKNSIAWQSIVEQGKEHLGTRNDYGSGRSGIEFIRHLWLISVPEEGTNNRYDYPFGLMYLLFVVPFFYVVLMSVKRKQFLIIPVIIIVYWFSWWIGSQQSRFLFIPIVLMFIVVSTEIQFHRRSLMVMMLIALSLVGLSVFRAHKADFGKSRYGALREKDKSLLALSEENPNAPVVLNYYDAAFAEVPVEVKDNDSVFVLRY